MSETTGEQQPPERPAETSDDEDYHDEIASKTERGLSGICTEPGKRKTANVKMLVIEAELVFDGGDPGNAAIPIDVETGEQLLERLEEHDDDLVPAWTRPGEGDE